MTREEGKGDRFCTLIRDTRRVERGRLYTREAWRKGEQRLRPRFDVFSVHAKALPRLSVRSHSSVPCCKGVYNLPTTNLSKASLVPAFVSLIKADTCLKAGCAESTAKGGEPSAPSSTGQTPLTHQLEQCTLTRSHLGARLLCPLQSDHTVSSQWRCGKSAREERASQQGQQPPRHDCTSSLRQRGYARQCSARDRTGLRISSRA